jgi:hypothetical protein
MEWPSGEADALLSGIGGDPSEVRRNAWIGHFAAG